MKKYLEEQIKFDISKFTSGFYATVLLIGGEIGLLLNGNLKESKILLASLMGFVFTLVIIIYLIYLNERIKSNINKLKNYE